MAKMPTYQEIRDDFERGARTAEQRIERPFRQRHPRPGDAATPMTPAAQPVNLAAATAAPQQEETMSLFDDAEKIYAGAKTELGKFEQALPGVLAKAKAFEASPFAQLAEKTAASVLPPEAVTIAVNAADRVLDDLIGLYSTPAPTDTQQQGVQQGAPAQ